MASAVLAAQTESGICPVCKLWMGHDAYLFERSAYDAGSLRKITADPETWQASTGTAADQGAFLPGDDQHAAEEAGDGGEAANQPGKCLGQGIWAAEMNATWLRWRPDIQIQFTNFRIHIRLE